MAMEVETSYKLQATSYKETDPERVNECSSLGREISVIELKSSSSSSSWSSFIWLVLSEKSGASLKDEDEDEDLGEAAASSRLGPDRLLERNPSQNIRLLGSCTTTPPHKDLGLPVTRLWTPAVVRHAAWNSACGLERELPSQKIPVFKRSDGSQHTFRPFDEPLQTPSGPSKHRHTKLSISPDLQNSAIRE
ncbi:hypothetical protein DL98DRAFT_513975 [Cadophora sp. DSE1049]|nr:hypothetical protein DL98DRAFT_513975 [Cadophora sp. DSE1049]